MAIPNPAQPRPTEIHAGDTLQWECVSDDYPPAEGYSLSHVFVTLVKLAEEEKLIEKYGLKLGTDAPEDAKEGDSTRSKGGSGGSA